MKRNYKKMKKVSVILSLLIVAISFTAAQTDQTTLVKVGSKAPSFVCTTIDGKTLDISGLQGKIIMINFFATWCGPCNTELPVLQKQIWEKYRNRSDFALIILGREHTKEEVKAFVEAKKFTMPFAPDPDRKIFSLYATQNIPRNIIIGKDGNILFQSTGYDEQEFKKLESLLAQELK
jgi:peroxiredoxin